MKKQKKLSLGKIKIAGISNVNSLIGGATTHCQTGKDNPYEHTCACAHTDQCETLLIEECPTTILTKGESDHCDGGEPDSRGAIC